jgi:hypothetical protein
MNFQLSPFPDFSQTGIVIGGDSSSDDASTINFKAI